MVQDFYGNLVENMYRDYVKEMTGNVETDEELEENIKKIEEFDVDKAFENMYTVIAKDIASDMRETMFEKVIEFRLDDQEFLAHHEKIWYKAFVASESMYIMVVESAQTYIKYVNNLDNEIKKSKYNTFTAMLHIHSRALQQFLEIITLMKNGFPDAAYARWRSMYELTVIAAFIFEHGESVAKAFIEARGTEDRYEWAGASDVFKSRKNYITFNDIQKSCKLNTDVWKKQYDLANKLVHASPQGTFARLGNMENCNILPVGRDVYGITTPAEHSAISLAQITRLFYSILPSGDSIVATKYIDRWVDTIREIYFKTHDEVFPKEKKKYDNSRLIKNEKNNKM